jgi:hypothetical protein
MLRGLNSRLWGNNFRIQMEGPVVHANLRQKAAAQRISGQHVCQLA